MTIHFAARVSRTDSKQLRPEVVTPLLRAGWQPATPGLEVTDSGPGPEGYGYAWTVGSVDGTETLVQTRPVVRADISEFSKDFLRTSANTALGMVMQRCGPFDAVGEVARFHRWIAVARGPSLDSAEDSVREDLEARLGPRLPDFLQRARTSSSSSEWGLFLVLAELHAMERLSSLPARPEEIRGAIARALELLGPNSLEHSDLLISDGATVAGTLSSHDLVHAVEATEDPAASCVLVTTNADVRSGLPDEGFMLRQAPSTRIWSVHVDAPSTLETST